MARHSLATMLGLDGLDDEEDAPKAARDPAIEAEVLRDLARAFLEPPQDFMVGDVVTWKSGLKNATVMGYGQPAVIVRLVPDIAPWLSEEQSSRGYYGHCPDVVVLFRDDDGDPMTAGVDSRRVRRMTDDELRIVPALAAE